MRRFVCTPATNSKLLCAFHTEVVGRCDHAGATPEWIKPECNSSLGIAVSLMVQALETAFAEVASKGMSVGAVLIVSPTYFGTCSDIAGE